jgi:hypothetical protein
MNFMFGRDVFTAKKENIRQYPEPRLVLHVKLENMFHFWVLQPVFYVMLDHTPPPSTLFQGAVCTAQKENIRQCPTLQLALHAQLENMFHCWGLQHVFYVMLEHTPPPPTLSTALFVTPLPYAIPVSICVLVALHLYQHACDAMTQTSRCTLLGCGLKIYSTAVHGCVTKDFSNLEAVLVNLARHKLHAQPTNMLQTVTPLLTGCALAVTTNHLIHSTLLHPGYMGLVTVHGAATMVTERI